MLEAAQSTLGEAIQVSHGAAAGADIRTAAAAAFVRGMSAVSILCAAVVLVTAFVLAALLVRRQRPAPRG
jgi:hypothetical protein